MAAIAAVAGRCAGLAIAIIGITVAATACGGSTPAEPSTPPAAPPSVEQPTAEQPTVEQPPLEEVSAEGVLAPPERAQNAFTYDSAAAPEGARLSVEAGGTDNGTQVRLRVTGLQPDRGYAAHAHAQACGPTGAAAGPHFQDEVDPAATPEKPSTDPAFANPSNEIWLDLRTDATGSGEATTEVPFEFDDRAPASVIIHANEVTATAPGQAGSAGGRVACLNVPFE